MFHDFVPEFCRWLESIYLPQRTAAVLAKMQSADATEAQVISASTLTVQIASWRDTVTTHVGAIAAGLGTVAAGAAASPPLLKGGIAEAAASTRRRPKLVLDAETQTVSAGDRLDASTQVTFVTRKVVAKAIFRRMALRRTLTRIRARVGVVTAWLHAAVVDVVNVVASDSAAAAPTAESAPPLQSSTVALVAAFISKWRQLASEDRLSQRTAEFLASLSPGSMNALGARLNHTTAASAVTAAAATRPTLSSTRAPQGVLPAQLLTRGSQTRAVQQRDFACQGSEHVLECQTASATSEPGGTGNSLFLCRQCRTNQVSVIRQEQHRLLLAPEPPVLRRGKSGTDPQRVPPPLPSGLQAPVPLRAAGAHDVLMPLTSFRVVPPLTLAPLAVAPGVQSVTHRAKQAAPPVRAQWAAASGW